MSVILGIIVAGFALIFAFQNTVFATVSFLTFQFSTSLALIILSALLIGFVIGLLLLLPLMIRSNMQNAAVRKENQQLKSKVDSSGIMYETEGLGSESERIPNDVETK